ncbi:hypothetical protein [Ahrensia sp. 13_GOM-1096m]|uniref:hypothetical protein n=1 Tax=Ahrensia sp. 13_GOM-1096m TaxID=1380380 RepID=UPI000687407B|nr:hypothetical protein [Ahrensia sp. 13_GOM-1096m]
MYDPVYEEIHKGHLIKIHHDPDPESPRSWDNLGTMVCGHSRYNLGDDHSFQGGRAFLLDLLDLDDEVPHNVDALLVKAEKMAVILPLYLYDHSGLAMNTTGFHCPWDSGQVGFIYATLAKIREEHNVARVSSSLREKIADQFRSEVSTYHDYLCGNVYGYTIEKDGEPIDSCWGFLGDYQTYCLEEARNVVAA